jgi:hypothetical protein
MFLSRRAAFSTALIAFSVGIGHIGGSKVSHYGSSSL